MMEEPKGTSSILDLPISRPPEVILGYDSGSNPWSLSYDDCGRSE